MIFPPRKVLPLFPTDLLYPKQVFLSFIVSELDIRHTMRRMFRIPMYEKKFSDFNRLAAAVKIFIGEWVAVMLKWDE